LELINSQIDFFFFFPINISETVVFSKNSQNKEQLGFRN